MIGSFKTNGIDKEKLKYLVEKLKNAGINAENVWKLGKREVEESHPSINFAEIHINNQWVMRQNIKAGSVKFDHLPENEKNKLLQEIKSIGFITKPNWGLGIGLYIMYLILITIIAFMKVEDNLLIPILVCSGLTSIGMFMFYLRAKDVFGDGIHVLSWIFLMLGFIATTPSCLLTIPLLAAITRFRLHDRITNLP